MIRALTVGLGGPQKIITFQTGQWQPEVWNSCSLDFYVTLEGFIKPPVLYINEKDGNTNTTAHKVTGPYFSST